MSSKLSSSENLGGHQLGDLKSLESLSLKGHGCCTSSSSVDELLSIRKLEVQHGGQSWQKGMKKHDGRFQKSGGVQFV